MKTLIFCTGYAPTLEKWELLYSRWINAVESSLLDVDTILIPDDGSPVLPEWQGIETINAGELPDIESSSRGIIYHYPDNLGRSSMYVYPGWYRSFMFAAIYAKKYGYEKVVHLESDAYIISEKMQTFVNEYTEGWTAFWCPKYQLPETAIQIIAGSSLDRYAELALTPYSKFSGRPADPGREQGDPWLPYVVNKTFYGDRWGENMGTTPKGADFTCQIDPTASCWWI